MKHLDPNDPRFTAKALGEEETQPINPEANEEFESLHQFAEELKSEFQAREDHEALTDEQRKRVRSAIQPGEKKVVRFPVWLSAVAACLVLGLVGIFSFKILDRSKTLITNAYPLSADLDQPNVVSTRKTGDLDDREMRVDGQLLETESERSQIAQVSKNPEPASQPARVDPIKRQAESVAKAAPKEEEIFELSAFTVQEDQSAGYAAASTLSGSRLMTEKKDTGAAVMVASDGFFDTSAAPVRPNTPEASRSRNSQKTVIAPPKQEPWNREAYDRIVENTFKSPVDHPLSTFSIDVDTASYANTRRYLNNGSLPPADAVRIEELINYFSYDYAEPDDNRPFAVHVDSASAPWNPEHRLVRIGLQGKEVDMSERPDANLVFLIDVSGSMSDQNKLPLVQRSLNLLVDQMEGRDRIAVVVYAGASGLALPSTTANNQETIQHAISNLQSGGSTNGGAGIELAYSVAQKHFVKDGINRVILCTDGDFNVGTTDRGSLTRMIEEKAKSGVFFSVLGFGMGNYQDASMEELSNKGNGNYGYVDSFKEARKVFVDDMLGTLFTIAKDVKIQVEFNPSQVASYRLVGYENRMLAKEDFNDDTKDAGEIGAGHSVTALYEIVPAGVEAAHIGSVDPLKYQNPAETSVKSEETLTVKLRYKEPDEDVSKLIEQPFSDSATKLNLASDDFRFATAVASFGMLLRNSDFTKSMSLEEVRTLGSTAKGTDSGGLRSEFIELIEKAISLTPEKEAVPASPEPRR